jgi:hypothetical protein
MPQRPGGVTAIAVLEFIGACFWAVLGIAVAVGGSLVGLLLGGANQKIGGGVLAGLGIAIAIIMWILAVLYVIVANGMLKLKNWARVVTIVFAGLAVLSGLAGFLISHGLIFTSLIRIALAAWILWYLMQPEVKAAFGASGSSV